ncbi:MAG: adaptor protein MecA [Clostridia bacterium]|nr:adaptor protein MecA [Clostridia bacterium]
MRIEDIEQGHKVRVLLTDRDLMEMDITKQKLTYDSPKLRDMLFRVIEFINKETSFNAKQGQIIVEATPHDDGILLTVWKTKTGRSCKKPMGVTVKKRTSEAMYHFKSFGALEEYLKIADEEILMTSSLSRLGETFLLSTASEDKKLLEFADKIPPITSGNGFISEHTEKVASGENLIKMANGIKMLK